jgi:hypothetical protein
MSSYFDLVVVVAAAAVVAVVPKKLVMEVGFIGFLTVPPFSS